MYWFVMSTHDSSDGNEKTEFERTVKEFGNGGHCTLPGEFVGEDVLITTVTDDESQADEKVIHPPITTEKVQSLLADCTREDFTLKQDREKDRLPREGIFQFNHDIRLSIDVELVHEGGGFPQHERNTIVHLIHEITEDELDDHYDGFDKSTDEWNWEMAYAVEPDVEHLFDHPTCVYNDLYQYTVQWNGSTVYRVKFGNRSAKNGRFYRPFYENFSSLSDYRSSFEYTLAVALTAAPQEDYDDYLEALNLDETVWADGDGEQSSDWDREAILDRCSIYSP